MMMIKSMMGSTRMMCLAGMASLSAGLGHAAESFRVEEATIAGIHQAMADRSLTCWNWCRPIWTASSPMITRMALECDPDTQSESTRRGRCPRR